jgi:cytochrome c oxidase cbb3-type subunit 3
MPLCCSIRWVLRSVACTVLASLAVACSHGQPDKPPTQPAVPVAAATRPPTPPPRVPKTTEPIDPTLAPHGAELYGRMCAVCHGKQGEGYRADQAPALGQQEFLASVSDDFLTFAITYGRTGTTMSAWHVDQGGPLSSNDIRAMLAFLRSWQRQPNLTLDDSPAQGNVTRGKAIFQQNCESCHSRKGPYVRIVNRQQLAKARSGFLRQAIRVGRPPTRMLGFQEKLGNEGVEDVVAYLQSLPGWIAPSEVPGATRPHPIPLGKVPLNPNGHEPVGFRAQPLMTSLDVIGPEYAKHARMVIIDARAPSDYLSGHIAGAVSVPFYDPSLYLDALPKHTWLVCYCGCPHAESGSLATQLLAAGFDKVTVLDEGFGAWIDKGYPVNTGLAP